MGRKRRVLKGRGLFWASGSWCYRCNSLKQHPLIELSAMMEIFYICAAHDSRHSPHMAIKIKFKTQSPRHVSEATIVDSPDMKHFHHCRNFHWTALLSRSTSLAFEDVIVVMVQNDSFLWAVIAPRTSTTPHNDTCTLTTWGPISLLISPLQYPAQDRFSLKI